MDRPSNESLAGVFQDVVRVLEQARVPYLVIGGLAQAVIGEPRLTQDVDCILFVQPGGIPTLLDRLQSAAFEVDRLNVQARLAATGTFSVKRGRWRVDMIVASTEFEQSALQRAQRVQLYGCEANFPTPEDLILLKLVPARDKDLLDAKTVMIRHRDQLDRRYLEQWAQRLSDEAEDPRIWQTLHRLLQEADTLSGNLGTATG